MADRALDARLAAGACVAGLVALYFAAFGFGAAADERVLDGFLSLRTPATAPWATFVTRFFDLPPYAVAVAIVLAAATWVGRARLAAAVGAIILGANLTTQLLKLLTAAPRDPSWLPDASFPSGHLTAATSLALCVVLIAPPALRAYAAGAGALGVLATTYSILVLGTHHPSDALGGMLVAGAWAGAVVAALERRDPAVAQGAPARRQTAWLALAAAAISVCALLALVAVVAPVGPYLSEHTTFAVGAVLLAASGALVPAVAAALAERSPG